MQSCMTLDDFLPGFRLLAIRWSDIDFDGETIRWRAEHEKTGYEHTTPLTAEALAVLEEARRMSRGDRESPGAALFEGCHEVHEPRFRLSVVEEGADPRGSGAEAGAGTRCGGSSQRT